MEFVKMLPKSMVKNHRKIMTTEEFKTSVNNLHPNKYNILGEYAGYEEPIHVIYNECGHEGNPKAKYLHYGKGCPKCHGPANKSHDEFIKRIEELYPGKYTILSKYTKSSERIDVLYNECGHTARPKAAYIRQGAGCPVCHRGTNISQEEFLEKFYAVAGDDYEPLEKYVNSQQKMKIRHNTCGTVFNRHIGNLFKIGCRCPKCNPSSRVLLTVGVNDIHTVNPELEALLKDPSDAYKYTQYTKDKLWFICPYCGNEIQKICYNVAANGLNCPRCNTNYSYGERFMSNLFAELNIKYEYQFSPDWIKPFSYDFYFSYNGINYIVEVDGGWHFEKNNKSNLSLEEIKERDNFKQIEAINHGYKVIRLDYNYKSNNDRSLYLINSINNSELVSLLDLQNYDYSNVINNSTKSMIKVVADLWNSYEEKAAQKIQADLNIKNDNKLRKWLYLAYELNMINESPEDIKRLNRAYGRKIYGSSNTKKVICNETGEIFNSFEEAHRKYNAHLSNYFKEDNRIYSGSLPDGTRLTWQLVDKKAS